MESVPSMSRAKILAVCLLAPMAAAGGACRSADVLASGGGGAGNVGGGNAGGRGSGANPGTGGSWLFIPDAGSLDACVPASAPAACTAPGGSYCGLIGDGCRGQIDCGNNCPAGWTCDPINNVCVGGLDCKPTYQCTYTAGSTSGSYCGKISDGCGHPLTCGDTCASLKTGWLCENNVCVGSASVCTPATCDPVAGARYCGKVGDGCGRGIDCGDKCANFQSGWVCNTATNSCVGGADCKKLVCDGNPNARTCGKVGDGWRNRRLRGHLFGLQGRLGVRHEPGPVRRGTQLCSHRLHRGRGRPVLRRHRRRVWWDAPLRRLPEQWDLQQQRLSRPRLRFDVCRAAQVR